jgi:hypothetical protein
MGDDGAGRALRDSLYHSTRATGQRECRPTRALGGFFARPLSAAEVRSVAPQVAARCSSRVTRSWRPGAGCIAGRTHRRRDRRPRRAGLSCVHPHLERHHHAPIGTMARALESAELQAMSGAAAWTDRRGIRAVGLPRTRRAKDRAWLTHSRHVGHELEVPVAPLGLKL